MRLYRPTGLAELKLVRDADWRAWPPRLPDQPIFYPVTTFDYAEKIARDWNSVLPAPNDVGFVTAFTISAETAATYPIQEAGGKAHTELWVPAVELDDFNQGIVGEIEVVAAYQGGSAADLEAVLARIGWT